MATEELILEYKNLCEQIKYHMDRYYNQDTPEISDYDYDQLMIRLKAIEKEHPEIIAKDSPTQIIGGTAKREAGVTVEHNVPMLSIQDVFSKEEVLDWVHSVRALHPDVKFDVEQKIDGLLISQTSQTNITAKKGKEGVLVKFSREMIQYFEKTVKI